MQNQIFSDAMDELHSSDGYYNNVIFRNNNIIMPFINLGISNHPLHKGDRLKFINYSYLVAEDVQYLDIWVPEMNTGKRCHVINRFKNENIYYWGGTNLDEKSIFNDMRICCKAAFIQTIEISRLSDNIWVPYDTPNQPLNTDKRVLDNFGEGAYMPDNIKDFIK